jgi:UDPglucose 6-dehydrogenase
MEIAVIGSGYVGLVAAACLAEIGHHVICMDNDVAKIAALRRGETTIHEEFLPVLLERHAGRHLHFTTSLLDAARQASVVFLAVGTPLSGDGRADVSVLESVCGDLVNQVSGSKLVVVKSTVPVGTNQRIGRLLQQNPSREQTFQFASNPEFLREGAAVTDFLYPDRIVLGCERRQTADLLQQVYQPLIDGSYLHSTNAIPVPDQARVPARVLVTKPGSAELIKQAANAFLATKISFINAIAHVCEARGADVDEVADGIGSDQRIGAEFLRPGIGYGGSCFPKDLRALCAVARESHYDFRLLEEVARINEDQRQRFVAKVRVVLRNLRGKKLAVLGLAFKGGTDDVRESPAIAIVRSLLKAGCQIVAHDPAALDRARGEFLEDSKISFVENAYEAAADADAVLILSEWEEFAVLQLDLLCQRLRRPIVIDGRNLYTRRQMEQAGLSYFSVGRPDVVPCERPASISEKEAA